MGARSHRKAFLEDYVASGSISVRLSSQAIARTTPALSSIVIAGKPRILQLQGTKQLEAAFKYLEKQGDLPIDKQELEQSCGVGVTVRSLT